MQMLLELLPTSYTSIRECCRNPKMLNEWSLPTSDLHSRTQKLCLRPRSEMRFCTTLLWTMRNGQLIELDIKFYTRQSLRCTSEHTWKKTNMARSSVRSPAHIQNQKFYYAGKSNWHVHTFALKNSNRVQSFFSAYSREARLHGRAFI